MSELQVIEECLRRVAYRRRLARAWGGLWRGLVAGSVLALLLLGAFRLFPLPLWTLIAGSAAPVAGMLIGAVLCGRRAPSLAETARWIDARQRLQERLSTALELSSEPGASSWGRLVIADAAAHLGKLDFARLLPLKLQRPAIISLVLLAVCAGLGFVPEYRSDNFLKKQVEREVIRDTGRQLAELTRRSLENRPPALDPVRAAMEDSKLFGEKLETKTLTRDEALKDLANLAEKLKQQVNELSKDPALQKMEQAAREQGEGGMDPARLQQEAAALRQQMAGVKGSPEKLEQLRQKLESLQAAAKGLESLGATAAERTKLGQSLSAAMKAAQDLGVQLPQLEQAMEALAAQKPGIFAQDLQTSIHDLEKLRDMAKAMQRLQANLEKLGKDLAEQLKKGQAEAAQSTLQQMANRLQQGNLNANDLKKMLEEVAKAVEPGKDYGKVAQHLQSATQQMNANQQKAAAQSLAAAAKELGSMLQQLGDAQQMLAEMENLNQASLAIASGKGWGACKKPGLGKGSRPGSGVGTWSEDEMGDWDGQLSERWDNSGINRPDMAPKGLTDRGQAPLNPALKPTQAKGQLSPGNQMPSISLKGLSIKGQSQVAYEEAATAAQADAQSAISQEKVPRAYQQSVKQYFDDLKK